MEVKTQMLNKIRQSQWGPGSMERSINYGSALWGDVSTAAYDLTVNFVMELNSAQIPWRDTVIFRRHK